MYKLINAIISMYKLINAIISTSFIRHATIIRTPSSGITRMTLANINCKEALRELDTATSQFVQSPHIKRGIRKPYV